MASLLLAAASIIGGVTYFHRASGQKASADLTEVRDTGNAHDQSRPQRQYATMSFVNRLARVNDEIVVASTNAANNPNYKSVYSTDPELEFLAARIKHAPPVEEFYNR